MGLTVKVRAANEETWRHIHRVRGFLSCCIHELIDRGTKHDQSKLASPEAEIFARCTDRLKGCTYGSEEYRGFLEEMKPALDHHYSHNRHHPEHFEHGIDDMSLVDLLEMLCDWRAATERHADGDIHKSIEINIKRFGISSQMVRILHNTADVLFS